jgi:hypothetical protein
MKCTILPLDVQLPDEPFAFSLQTLVELLHTIPDRRAKRGVRYPLPVVLTVAVLAKLAGHGKLRAVAEWARLCAEQLCPLLGFERARSVRKCRSCVQRPFIHHPSWLLDCLASRCCLNRIQLLGR